MPEVTLAVVREIPVRAVAVYAHPDDADVSCGGTLALWSGHGCEVRLVVCAQGDKGATERVADVERLVDVRRAEVAAAALELGIASVDHLGRPDGEVENDVSLRRDLVRVIRDARAEVVICPDPTAVFFGEHYFNHHDHRAVGWAALDAVFPAASSPLYFPDAGEAWPVRHVFLSGSLEANVAVDVTSVIERKADAVRCHRSQLGEEGEWFGEAVRDRAEEAGRLGGVAFAEAFRRVTLGQ
ncbi:MAG TPA: PIG-L deacetylase family protein [Acidimicrobiales bacterium]|nr:PIG-L deacetylase family protein [Acidimicrobiales bacterium]